MSGPAVLAAWAVDCRDPGARPTRLCFPSRSVKTEFIIEALLIVVIRNLNHRWVFFLSES